MAGIDKLYCPTYKDYLELVKWANDKEITFTIGKKTITYHLINFIYDYDKDDFYEGCCVMNNPTWVDIYLMQNCPLQFVVGRLKNQYNDHYDEMLNTKLGVLPDDFKKNRKIRIVHNERTGLPLTNKNLVSISFYGEGGMLRYNEDFDAMLPFETFPGSSFSLHVKSYRDAKRRLQNMYLPVCRCTVRGKYVGEYYDLIIE